MLYVQRQRTTGTCISEGPQGIRVSGTHESHSPSRFFKLCSCPIYTRQVRLDNYRGSPLLKTRLFLTDVCVFLPMSKDSLYLLVSQDSIVKNESSKKGYNRLVNTTFTSVPSLCILSSIREEVN